jgi:hypothetical protein
LENSSNSKNFISIRKKNRTKKKYLDQPGRRFECFWEFRMLEEARIDLKPLLVKCEEREDGGRRGEERRWREEREGECRR